MEGGKMKKTPIPESANRITANIIRIANMTPNCYAFRVNNTGIWDEKKQVFRTAREKGIADIVCCFRGRFYAFEVKAGKDRQSDYQKVFQFLTEKANGQYFIIRSTDDFIEIWNGIRSANTQILC